MKPFYLSLPSMIRGNAKLFRGRGLLPMRGFQCGVTFSRSSLLSPWGSRASARGLCTNDYRRPVVRIVVLRRCAPQKLIRRDSHIRGGEELRSFAGGISSLPLCGARSPEARLHGLCVANRERPECACCKCRKRRLVCIVNWKLTLWTRTETADPADLSSSRVQGRNSPARHG
jgi:hypothetical protein